MLRGMATDTKNTGRESDKFMLRLPEGMRERVAELAKANGRTMNAEIVSRLERSLKDENVAGTQAAMLSEIYSLLDGQKNELVEVLREAMPPISFEHEHVLGGLKVGDVPPAMIRRHADLYMALERNRIRREAAQARLLSLEALKASLSVRLEMLSDKGQDTTDTWKGVTARFAKAQEEAEEAFHLIDELQSADNELNVQIIQLSRMFGSLKVDPRTNPALTPDAASNTELLNQLQRERIASERAQLALAAAAPAESPAKSPNARKPTT